MSWIKLEDGTYAEEANPDPKRVLTIEQLQKESYKLGKEITMHEQEITIINQRIDKLQSQKDEIDTILNG